MKCAQCGQEFERRPRQNTKVYCNEKCKREAARALVPVKIVVQLHCEGCGVLFDPTMKTRRFCTQKCRTNHNRKHRPAKKRTGKFTMPPRLKVPPPQSRIWDGYGT